MATRTEARAFAHVLGLLLLLPTACSHDLDALQASGTGTAGSSVELRDGGTDSQTMDSDAGGLAACAPCVAPEPLASGTIVPASCCTGQNRRECGARIGQGQCVTLDSPGVETTSCPELTRAGTTFSGCCRADAQCGVMVGPFGCVARPDVPLLLGGPLTARACSVGCTGDADCRALADDLICIEDETHTAGARSCARGCTRDKDCDGLTGTVCAIQNNITDNRLDLFCGEPFGPGELNDDCTRAEDCARGTCVADNRFSPPRRFCTQLCSVDLDCPGTNDDCIGTTIPLPDMTDTQSLEICWNRSL